SRRRRHTRSKRDWSSDVCSSDLGVGRFMLVTGTILAGLMVLLALFAPLIAPYGFAQVADAEGARFANHAPPGGEHWLGTSTQGRSEERRVGKEGRHRGRRAAAAV